MKTPLDVEDFFNRTLFGLDILAMLSDIEDFIDFSEANIEWQKLRELRRAEFECDEEQFDDMNFAAHYREQTIEGVSYRFDVSLTQRVRYAALISFITTIEWVLISLRKRAAFAVPKKPERKNGAVHLLQVFNHKASLNLASQIQIIEDLTHVRNCIVHAAGLLESYKHESELRQRLSAFPGIKISNISFLGDGIEIERSYLQDLVEDAKRWLPSLEKAMHEQGLLEK